MVMEYVIIGATAGAVWSFLGWLKAKADKEQSTRWDDFDPFKAGVTILKNAVGAGLGVFLYQSTTGNLPTVEFAVLSGLVGAKLYDLLQAHAGKVLDWLK